MDATSSAPPPSPDPGALIPEDPAFDAASCAKEHFRRNAARCGGAAEPKPQGESDPA
jgi:hypothetical protein